MALLDKWGGQQGLQGLTENCGSSCSFVTEAVATTFRPFPPLMIVQLPSPCNTE